MKGSWGCLQCAYGSGYPLPSSMPRKIQAGHLRLSGAAHQHSIISSSLVFLLVGVSTNHITTLTISVGEDNNR